MSLWAEMAPKDARHHTSQSVFHPPVPHGRRILPPEACPLTATGADYNIPGLFQLVTLSFSSPCPTGIEALLAYCCTLDSFLVLLCWSLLPIKFILSHILMVETSFLFCGQYSLMHLLRLWPESQELPVSGCVWLTFKRPCFSVNCESQFCWAACSWLADITSRAWSMAPWWLLAGD